MRNIKPVGRTASVVKYDVLTALGAHGCIGDKSLQRLVLRFITLIVARYNWQTGELAVGQREMAALWGVDERTVKRDLARLRSLGWLEVTRPAVRGRVAVHTLRMEAILAATRDDWARVGPDFAERMGGTADAPPPKGNVISFPQPPRPEGRGAWPEVMGLLHAENPALYASWFAPLVAECDGAGVMTVRAPSRFHATFVRTHYLSRLRDMVRARDPGVCELAILG
jgi:hypothetical protein